MNTHISDKAHALLQEKYAVFNELCKSELQEMNKREVKINYDEMLSKYDKLRQVEAAKEEEEDEQFVRQVFGKDNGVKIKRIVDDGDDDDDEIDVPKPKLAKVEKATDILTASASASSSAAVKPVWEKSVGSLNLKKGLLVIKKKAPEVKPSPVSTSASSSSSSASTGITTSSKPASSGLLGLGLLGSYSDSDENSD